MTDQTIAYGKYEGRSFSWIVANRPHYVAWARTQPSPMPQMMALVRFADTHAGFLCGLGTIVNDTMSLGFHRGRSFAWIVRNDPWYIRFCAEKVPQCSTEFFRLAPYAQNDESAAFEQAWGLLRQRHCDWMHQRALRLGHIF